MDLVDIHCHLLPYVDDGAENFTEACNLLEAQLRQGVQTICFTPHWRTEMFESTQDAVDAQFARLQAEAAQRYPQLRLYLGREYFCDSEFLEGLRQASPCCLGQGKTLLLEFSGRYTFDIIYRRVQQVQQKGWQVLVAHVERYPSLHQQADAVQRLRAAGALIQVNAGAILGREGLQTKRLCKKLLKAGLVDVVASDAHGTAFRPPELGACAAYLEKKLGRAAATRLVHDMPLQVLQPGDPANV